MSIRARLAKLEAIKEKNDPNMSAEEIDALFGEVILCGQTTVHYALTHPNGCFMPPVGIGREVEDITLEEIVTFENTPWAVIDDLDRQVAQFLLEEKAEK